MESLPSHLNTPSRMKILSASVRILPAAITLLLLACAVPTDPLDDKEAESLGGRAVDYDDLFPAPHPDGLGVAFVRRRGSLYKEAKPPGLYLQSSDTTPAELLLSGDYIDGPQWVDGQHILMSKIGSFSGVVLLNTSTGTIDTLLIGAVSRPSLDHDLKTLCFEDMSGVWVRRLKSGDTQRILGIDFFEPMIHPSGQYLMAVDGRTSRDLLVLSDLDGHVFSTIPIPLDQAVSPTRIRFPHWDWKGIRISATAIFQDRIETSHEVIVGIHVASGTYTEYAIANQYPAPLATGEAIAYSGESDTASGHGLRIFVLFPTEGVVVQITQ